MMALARDPNLFAALRRHLFEQMASDQSGNGVQSLSVGMCNSIADACATYAIEFFKKYELPKVTKGRK